MKPWLGDAWAFAYSLPGWTGKSPAAIWALAVDDKEKLATHTADLLEALPPQWFDRIFKLLETTLPGIALVGTVTVITVQKLAMHAMWKAQMNGAPVHRTEAPEGGE